MLGLLFKELLLKICVLKYKKLSLGINNKIVTGDNELTEIFNNHYINIV